MKYKPLFKLSITHTYYSDQRCPDFVIEASSETETLLKNHRCVSRVQADGLIILIALDGEGRPFIPLLPDAIFSFYLRLRNPDFAFFTDLSPFAGNAVPMFSNATLNAEDKILPLSARSATFSESFFSTTPTLNEGFALSGRPLPGSTFNDFQVTGAGEVKVFDATLNAIEVDTGSLQPGEMFSVSYPVVPRLPQRTFAEVNIHNNDSLPSGEGVLLELSLFQIGFSAKQARWTYYCVTDLSPSLGELRIEDATPTLSNRLTFSAQNRTDLDTDLDPRDKVALTLKDQYPAFRKIRFLSDEPVACRQAASQQIEFHLGENRLSAALPNPSFKNNSKVSIMEGNTAKEEDALFQVIKYLTV